MVLDYAERSFPPEWIILDTQAFDVTEPGDAENVTGQLMVQVEKHKKIWNWRKTVLKKDNAKELSGDFQEKYTYSICLWGNILL